MKKLNRYYVYIYLDNRKPDIYQYKEWTFNYQPFYVGQGKNERMEHHLKGYSLSDDSIKSNTIKAIMKFGNEPIRFKLYENLTEEESLKIEEDLVDYFGKRKDGGILTNLRDGGTGKNFRVSEEVAQKLSESKKGKYSPLSKRIDQFDLEGNFIQKWESLIEIKDAFNLKSGCNISACCKGITKNSIGFVWKYDGTSPYVKAEKSNPLSARCEIFQYDLDGNRIGSFLSIVDAAEFLDIKTSTIRSVSGGIGACASGLQNEAFGFYWSYTDLGDKLDKDSLFKKLRRTPISCYNENGDLVKSFRSLLKAGQYIGSRHITLHRACETGKLFKGYYWKLD